MIRRRKRYYSGPTSRVETGAGQVSSSLATAELYDKVMGRKERGLEEPYNDFLDLSRRVEVGRPPSKPDDILLKTSWATFTQHTDIPI